MNHKMMGITLMLAVSIMSLGNMSLGNISLGKSAKAQEQSASKNGQHLVQLDAIASQGAPPIREGVNFRIIPYGPVGEEIHARAHNGKAAQVSLAKGRYHIETQYGATTRVNDIIVSDAPSQHVVDLQAGWVELKLLKDYRSKPLKDAAISWKILTHRKGMDGKRGLVHEAKGARPVIALPYGWYVVEVTYKGKTTKHSVEVQLGNALEYRLVHG